MLMNLAGSAQTLIIAGVGAFSFKFLTEQYNLDFDTSGYLIGKCTVFTVTIPRHFTTQILSGPALSLYKERALLVCIPLQVV